MKKLELLGVCLLIVLMVYWFVWYKAANTQKWMAKFNAISVGQPKENVELTFGESVANEGSRFRYSPGGCTILIEVDYDKSEKVFDKRLTDTD